MSNSMDWSWCRNHARWHADGLCSYATDGLYEESSPAVANFDGTPEQLARFQAYRRVVARQQAATTAGCEREIDVELGLAQTWAGASVAWHLLDKWRTSAEQLVIDGEGATLIPIPAEALFVLTNWIHVDKRQRGSKFEQVAEGKKTQPGQRRPQVVDGARVCWNEGLAYIVKHVSPAELNEAAKNGTFEYQGMDQFYEAHGLEGPFPPATVELARISEERLHAEAERWKANYDSFLATLQQRNGEVFGGTPPSVPLERLARILADAERTKRV